MTPHHCYHPGPQARPVHPVISAGHFCDCHPHGRLHARQFQRPKSNTLPYESQPDLVEEDTRDPPEGEVQGGGLVLFAWSTLWSLGVTTLLFLYFSLVSVERERDERCGLYPELPLHYFKPKNE